MKIHNWEEVIKYFLIENHDEGFLWNYVTALRSGDGVHDIWKSLITCLIRGNGLYSMAWDISFGKDCLNLYSDDIIRFRLIESSKKIPIHYFYHSRKGLEALAFYYREKNKNDEIANLLIELSKKVDRDRKEIPEIARQIINILHEDEK